MKNIILVVATLFVVACGGTTERNHSDSDLVTPDDVSFRDDPVIDMPASPEAGSQSVTMGGSSGNGVAGTASGGMVGSAGIQADAGANNMNVGGESAVGGSTSEAGAGGEGYSPCLDCPVDLQPDTCESTRAVTGLEDGEYRQYDISSWVEFSLNPASPSGMVGDRLQEVIRVDAKAKCGDMILEHVLFQITEHGNNDMVWMLAVHQEETLSGISYEYQGIHVFEGYGKEHINKTYSSLTGLYWDHAFATPIVIKKDETFTFWLSVTFGSVRPEGTFNFRLYPRASWHSVDDPDAYPEVIWIGSDAAEGNNLTYAP